LRQSIVVAKPVRHENPARESLIGGRLGSRASSGLFVARPDVILGPVSRHESHSQRGSRNVLGEISTISAKKDFENLSSFPTAGLGLPNLGQVLRNVTSTEASRKPPRSTGSISGTRRSAGADFHA
jgi:hypothetical protein